MDFQKSLYKLYVFLLPFNTVFNMRGESINIWHYLKASSVVMLLGVFLLITSSKNVFGKETGKWLKMVVFMLFYMTICAVIVDFTMGMMNGETAYSVLPHNYFFLLIFLLTIAYNIYFFKHYISFKDLIPIFKAQSIILLMVGALQYLTLRGLGIAGAINQGLSMVFCMRSTDYLFRIDHGITLFGNEPSSVAMVCLWLLPFVFLYAYYTRKTFYIIQAAAWTFLMFNTGSSTNLISFVVMIACLMFIIRGRSIPKYVYGGAFVAGLAMALVYAHGDLGKLNIKKDETNIEYILYGKLFDVYGNGSMAVRASTIANGVKVFEEYPVTGIGDGLQGYKYNQNAPDWVVYSPFTENFMSGESGIVEGGGGFLGSYLSGYGIIGIIALLIFLSNYKKDLYALRNNLLVRNIFGIAVVIFIFSAWHSMGLNSYVAFVFSLPYAANFVSKENEIVKYFS